MAKYTQNVVVQTSWDSLGQVDFCEYGKIVGDCVLHDIGDCDENR